MKTMYGVAAAAVLIVAAYTNTASAAYLGAACYQKAGCGVEVADTSCQKPQCYTVMKTCRKVVYEKQQVTCYRTVRETVCETRTIDCVKYVPQTC